MTDAGDGDSKKPRLRVMDAAYLLSGSTNDQLGPPTAPEIAFLGRSNVGKSSLLNALLHRKDLVRTSRTPGQTRYVNLFGVDVARITRSGAAADNKRIVFADLPGYGFAHISKDERARISRLLSDYLGKREQLLACVHLVDARHGATKDDVEVHAELRALARQIFVVATKADKLKASERVGARKTVAKALGIEPSAVALLSGTEKTGVPELLARLWEIVPSSS